MSYDENKVQDLIETAARLSMVIGPGEAGALNELRVALQGIAMLDGVSVPEEPRRIFEDAGRPSSSK